MTRLCKSQTGQATVLTAVAIAALAAMAALVLDVGSWFRADRAAQSAADAAALAAAQALPENPGLASALASSYLSKNGGGSITVTYGTKQWTNDSVTVEVTRPAPGFFAKLFGVESVQVGAKATARSGGPTNARWAAPIAVDERHPLLQCSPTPCFEEATTLDLETVGPGAFRLLNLDDSKGGTGPDDVARWISDGYDGYMPLNWYYSDPGAKFSASQIKAAMEERIGDELLFPVYRETSSGGANFEYHVVGWVGFHVTGFTAHGNSGTVSGHFTRIIWEGVLSGSGTTGPDFGVRSIQLVE
jgi:hypothetical protein